MKEALFLVSTNYIFASVAVLSEVKDTHNLNEKRMFYDLSPKSKHEWSLMRHEIFIIKSKCKIPFTHTFSSALNAVKRNMFVLGLRMLLIESFPGFLECTTEEKILHKLLHAKTNLPLGAHIFVSRVCTYIVSSAHTVQSVHTAQCTHCTVHTLHTALPNNCTLYTNKCLLYTTPILLPSFNIQGNRGATQRLSLLLIHQKFIHQTI